jgi:hypothetical protein
MNRKIKVNVLVIEYANPLWILYFPQLGITLSIKVKERLLSNGLSYLSVVYGS